MSCVIVPERAAVLVFPFSECVRPRGKKVCFIQNQLRWADNDEEEEAINTRQKQGDKNILKSKGTDITAYIDTFGNRLRE